MLTKVGEFIFSVDIVVLENDAMMSPENEIPTINGRPFLAIVMPSLIVAMGK